MLFGNIFGIRAEKQSKSLDFMAYFVFKDFDKNNFILRATLHPKMAIKFERNHLEA